MNVNDLGFDLKRPCKDCPFRMSTPKHGGIADSLPDYLRSVETGTFVHTCHKTDPRADSIEGKAYKGKTQHCAGALALMKNDFTVKSFHVGLRERRGELDLGRIDREGVYPSLKAFVKSYYDWLIAGMPDDLAEETGSEVEAFERIKGVKYVRPLTKKQRKFLQRRRGRFK